ncbi:MAG: glycosyltransferase family 4 protein [Phycisphaerales bacterium JB043]
MIDVLALILVSAAVGSVFTVVGERLARQLGWLSPTNPYFKDHDKPVALGGGVSLMTTAACVFLAWPIDMDTITRFATIAAIGCGMIGLLDDLRSLSPPTKFLLQAVVASAFVVGVSPATQDWTGLAMLATGVVFVIAFINAFNLLDVSDGLLPGVSLVSFACFAMISPAMREVCLVASGLCAGFLLRNAPPASVFLGDSGSLALGGLAGCLAWGWVSTDPVGRAIPAVLVFGVPLFELVFLIVVRQAGRKAPWHASCDHVAIRLRSAGLSKGAIVLVGLLVAAVFGGAGVAAVDEGPRISLVLGSAAIALVATLALLRFAPAPRGES